MKTKLVKRHWCDFCNKAGLQARAMGVHEKHCTLNPARDCRVCGLIGASTHIGAERMAFLVSMLPSPVEYSGDGDGRPAVEYVNFCEALRTAIPTLREEVDNCPACILAALRQKKIPVPMVEDFNFTTEMQAVLSEANQRRHEDGYY